MKRSMAVPSWEIEWTARTEVLWVSPSDCVDDVTVQASACNTTSPVPGVPAGAGDLDGDTFVDAADLVLLAHFLAENLPVIPAGMYQADLNADARVNVVDGVLLARLLAGIL
jgi:hypothetical protein